MEAVATRFSATWEKGDDAADAYLVVAGKRVAVDIRTLKRRGNGQGSAARPGLRFDKVANRLMERLKANLGDSVPYGVTVLATIAAPIRLPSKTAAALEERIRTLVGRRARARDEKDTILRNRVRIRLMRDESGRAPKMIGFVHNSDSEPPLLLDMTGEFLELVSAEAHRRAGGLPGDRWLVVISAGGSSWLEAYRYICSRLRLATELKMVLMVFGDGRVGVVTG